MCIYIYAHRESQLLRQWISAIGERFEIMREKIIERALTVACRKRDGVALKFISPGVDGVPDRIVLFPGGRVAFIELKAPGEKMRPLQEKRKRQLVRLGFRVYCVDEMRQIEEVLDAIQAP